ncbi:MAG TPA: hypothetical protein VMH33_13130 [Solirubrobacterales bacterium]|nr:hypothetical protein [Solirubrobacterales bacterium]
MRKRILVPLALMVLAGLTLAACGGGGSSAESEITEVIETAATTQDPSNCTEYATQRFNEQNEQTQGAEATSVCEEEEESQEGSLTEKATVSNVSVEGEEATAEVEFEGGKLTEQKLEVALVEEEGQWKLDQIEGFAEYNGAALAGVFQETLDKESPEGLSEEQLTCIIGGISEASAGEAEELFFSGSKEPLEELAEECA